MASATYSDNRDLLDAEALAACERSAAACIDSGELKPGDKIYNADEVEYTVLDCVDKDGDAWFGVRAPHGLIEVRWDILETQFHYRLD